MKKLLCATALTCVLSFSAAHVMANDMEKMKDHDSFVIKASYVLPKKDGDEFRQTLHEADEENLQNRQQIMLDHADMYDILTAPDFDRKAFLAKAEEVRNLMNQMKENRDQAFASAVNELTSDERIKLADALDTMPKHKSGHHQHHAQNAPASNHSTATQ
jgi:uncharacterized membrane protein